MSNNSVSLREQPNVGTLNVVLKCRIASTVLQLTLVNELTEEKKRLT